MSLVCELFVVLPAFFIPLIVQLPVFRILLFLSRREILAETRGSRTRSDPLEGKGTNSISDQSG